MMFVGLFEDAKLMMDPLQNFWPKNCFGLKVSKEVRRFILLWILALFEDDTFGVHVMGTRKISADITALRWPWHRLKRDNFLTIESSYRLQIVSERSLVEVKVPKMAFFKKQILHGGFENFSNKIFRDQGAC